MLETFDAPQLNPNCLQRPVSTVASQSLLLWNSDTVRENARYFAGRVIDHVGPEIARQVDQVYLTALTRWPTAGEQRLAEAEIEQLTQDWLKHHESDVPAEPRRMAAQWEALAVFCHAVMNSAEFVYLD